MTTLYCDTSVVVAYYVPEVHSASAESVLSTHPQRIISPLVITEFSSALRRKVHNETLTTPHAQAAWEDFKRDLSSGIFQLTELSRQDYEHAATTMWRVKERLRTLDALHIAITEREGYTLATSDELMATISTSLGLRTIRVNAPASP